MFEKTFKGKLIDLLTKEIYQDEIVFTKKEMILSERDWQGKSKIPSALIGVHNRKRYTATFLEENESGSDLSRVLIRFREGDKEVSGYLKTNQENIEIARWIHKRTWLSKNWSALLVGAISGIVSHIITRLIMCH